MWNHSMEQNKKIKWGVMLLTGFLWAMAVIVPGSLWAIQAPPSSDNCDQSQFAAKEARANRYFESEVAALADQKDGSLYSCANIDNNADQTAAFTLACALFSLPGEFCGTVAGLSYEGDHHNAQVAGTLKVALFGEFQLAMGYFQAHPDRSNFVVAQLETAFRGILGNPAYRCQNTGQAIDDLNNLASRTLFAYILAPATNQNVLLKNIFRADQEGKL